jgi:outer membrane immunogenic protein
MKRFLIAFAAVLLGSTSALAADAVAEAPVEMPVEQAPIFTWTGAYVGAQAGYGWGDSELSTNIAGVGASLPFDPDGFLGGVHAGYNYQFSNDIVLGVEADIDYSDLSGDGTLDIGGIDTGIDGSSKLEWQGSVRARLGYAVDRWLPYVTGGVAFGKYKHDIDFPDGTSFNDDDTYTGWTAGAGVEYAFTDNWTGRLEYRYTDFGDQDFSNALGDYNVDLNTHAVKVGISYKF